MLVETPMIPIASRRNRCSNSYGFYGMELLDPTHQQDILLVEVLVVRTYLVLLVVTVVVVTEHVTTRSI